MCEKPARKWAGKRASEAEKGAKKAKSAQKEALFARPRPRPAGQARASSGILFRPAAHKRVQKIGAQSGQQEGEGVKKGGKEAASSFFLLSKAAYGKSANGAHFGYAFFWRSVSGVGRRCGEGKMGKKGAREGGEMGGGRKG